MAQIQSAAPIVAVVKLIVQDEKEYLNALYGPQRAQSVQDRRDAMRFKILDFCKSRRARRPLVQIDQSNVFGTAEFGDDMNVVSRIACCDGETAMLQCLDGTFDFGRPDQ